MVFGINLFSFQSYFTSFRRKLTAFSSDDKNDKQQIFIGMKYATALSVYYEHDCYSLFLTHAE
jgi:hypothetical protein